MDAPTTTLTVVNQVVDPDPFVPRTNPSPTYINRDIHPYFRTQNTTLSNTVTPPTTTLSNTVTPPTTTLGSPITPVKPTTVTNINIYYVIGGIALVAVILSAKK